MLNEVVVNDNKKIEDMIYEIRGKYVMVDSDIARLYECKNGTKEINQAVKNNLAKFPERFSWVLNESEWHFLRSKNLTLENNSSGRGRYRKYLPRVFTEQGVAMLATILKTKVATEVSIRIMDAFVSMRHYMSSNLLEQKYINNMVMEHEYEIKLLQESFNKFEEKKKVTEIYFNGQIFDAYSKIHDILKSANESIVVIDAYADNTVLDIIKRLDVSVTIITKSNNLLTKQDICKYNKQYSNLKVVYDNTFHDRYFILDNKIIYHCGSSINRIGYRTFSINLVSDDEICKLLIGRINSLDKNFNDMDNKC